MPYFTQIESIINKFPHFHLFICRDTIPPFIRNRISFHYHIDRTRYFLEQGSVKGVKKEVFSRDRSHAGEIVKRFFPFFRLRIRFRLSRATSSALLLSQCILVVTSRRDPRSSPRFREPRLSSSDSEKPVGVSSREFGENCHLVESDLRKTGRSRFRGSSPQRFVLLFVVKHCLLRERQIRTRALFSSTGSSLRTARKPRVWHSRRLTAQPRGFVAASAGFRVGSGMAEKVSFFADPKPGLLAAVR